MISRQLKALYFTLAGPLMRVNAAAYRAFRAPETGNGSRVRVHLGPGQTNYLYGWVNVDTNIVTARCDVWAELNHGLPFRDGSVDAIYSHHVIEHLPDLKTHFAEMFRVLKPGGVIRVGGPNGDSAIREYLAGNKAWFGDFPEKRTSIGGRMENFILCKGEHLTILTPSFMTELAETAGFTDVHIVQPIKETFHPDVFDASVLSLEWEDTPNSPHTLLIEARKPGA